MDILLQFSSPFDRISLVLCKNRVIRLHQEVKSMANIKSAIKRAKLSEERRAHNASIKSDMRSAVKTVEALVTNNDLENAKEAFKTASKNLTKQLVKVLSTKTLQLVKNLA